MICFYHSADLDGHCSGAIVKNFNPDCELIGIDYGDEFPWDKIIDQDVVMVDFSLQSFEQMIRLKKEAKSLVWIDHHISAIRKAIDYKFTTEGMLNTKFAACELAWKYYTNVKMPRIVYLLGRYDVWDHENENVLCLQYSIRQHDTDPKRTNNVWQNWFVNFPQMLLERGYFVLNYVKQEDKKYIEQCAFETELDGHRCIAVNKMLASSKLFDSIWDPEKYHMMLTFGFKKYRWVVSLYTTRPDVDVSYIATERGGGGHQQAAGFQCDTLPFDYK